MFLNGLNGFWMRHRSTLIGLSCIFALSLASLAFVYEVDVFPNESGGVKANAIELDEALAVSGLTTLALFVFAVRQYFRSRREVEARIEAERKARELAYQDGLTGLPNRRQFDDALKAAIDSPPAAGATHAVLLLDLNGFKKVNDVHGHAIGDHVLAITAQRLRVAIRDPDLAARFGGDEFAILATHLPSPEVATTIALRVIESLKAPIEAESHTHNVGVAIGIALIPDDGTTGAEILRKADVALYRAKAERRSTLRFFEPAMDALVRERTSMEQSLREALGKRHIKASFLPNVSLSTHRIVGFEARPRWIDPLRGEIPLQRFLEIADESGLIHDLLDQLLREACETAQEWPSDIKLSLDVHPSQLKDSNWPERLITILRELRIEPARLELEIAESALVADLHGAQQNLGKLKNAGVRVVLDNFGTGYSSLYHLRNFPLDKIKIDRSFIDHIAQEQASAGIVNALVGLAHGLGLTIAADGIEGFEQEAALMSSGCEQGQGGFFSQAISAKETSSLFSREATTSLYLPRQPKAL